MILVQNRITVCADKYKFIAQVKGKLEASGVRKIPRVQKTRNGGWT